MSSLLIRRVLSGCLVLLAACTDPYMPEVITSPPSYLVVDGFLNAQGVTTINLSRTYAVASKATQPVETQATAYIEDEAGTRLPLTEGTVKGTYTSAAQTLNPARKYRLHLRTQAGKEYVSDYVPVKITPAFDAVDWRAEREGLGIYVSTHDDANATQYYRWEYEETWEIIPPLRPSLEFLNNNIIPIRVPYPTVCWGTERSPIVQLTKTTSLSQDVVSNFLLRRLPQNSDRIFRRYSLLVQQHALTKEEYAYWDLLRKNTESIGTLFDPQPAQLTGNVHCVNSPDDLAMGFVGAHTLQQRRIFVERTQLPFSWPFNDGFTGCYPPDTLDLSKVKNPFQIFRSGVALPVGQIPKGYTISTLDCVDCRRKGTTVRPSFW
ncbi:DUF4249 domain-containing protein [Hymenobacter monticola]|uniref:DUF4249 domain-containing protein n=1 Tax=Hymenobacter monticola TaxID=1705399 RepID=A0ABY4B7L8_9BACT|nr:DUF4249 domain-containing protein [Hymenobacter monticola]UOE35166.1 DUF4249 domain-containing protein [Hymenobacter monticola]